MGISHRLTPERGEGQDGPSNYYRAGEIGKSTAARLLDSTPESKWSPAPRKPQRCEVPACWHFIPRWLSTQIDGLTCHGPATTSTPRG
jgi:hypothetical protein